MKSIRVFDVLKKDTFGDWVHFAYYEEKPQNWYGSKGVKPFAEYEDCGEVMAAEKEIEPTILDIRFAPRLFYGWTQEIKDADSKFAHCVCRYNDCIVLSNEKIFCPFPSISKAEISEYFSRHSVADWARKQHEVWVNINQERM